MKNLFVVPMLLILSLLIVQPAFAQSSKEMDAIREDIKALKEGQQSILKEIATIKKRLTARPAPPAFKETVVNVDGDPFKGSKDAKFAVIEFSDYQ